MSVCKLRFAFCRKQWQDMPFATFSERGLKTGNGSCDLMSTRAPLGSDLTPTLGTLTFWVSI